MSKTTRSTRSQKTPIRGNLVFSTSPPPLAVLKKVKKTPAKKKIIPTKRRGSLSSVVTKVDRSRRAQKSEPQEEEAENISEHEDIDEVEEADNKMEEVIEEVEEPAQEKVVKKSSRSRTAKAKPEPKPKKQAVESKPKVQVTKRSRAKKVVEADKTFVVNHRDVADTKLSDEEMVVQTGEEEDKEDVVAKIEEVKEVEPRGELDFTKLKFNRVIDDSMVSKTITYEGTYEDETAVIRLERLVFDDNTTRKALVDEGTTSSRNFINDVYSSYIINLPNFANTINDVKATVVWPANEKVLAKYSRSEMIFFHESPDVYSKVVEPFIENLLTSDKDYNNWVYNILDGKSEVERVIFNDPDPNSGFILAQDLKWSGDEKDVNLLAICNLRDIRSLRDLNDKHLTLLKNIMTKGTKVIKDKYKKVKGQLRSYIHYQPSFYHFHVHFKMVDPGEYQSTDRDNLLSTVINNISLNKDYYKKSTLTYPLAVSSALYQELKKAKKV